jgi:hypothetical protein
MGDSDHIIETWVQLQKRQIVSDRFLGRHLLSLDKESISWILNNVYCFVSESRGNETVTDLVLNPYVPFAADAGILDKLGQTVGNLQALERIEISTDIYDEDDEDPSTPDWETIAVILSHVQQKITLMVCPYYSAWCAEDIQSFVGVIRGHPTITGFKEGEYFPFQSASLYSTLAKFPALESVTLSNSERQAQPEDGSSRQAQPEDGSSLAHQESLTDLLRAPCLRSVSFYEFYFTRALCQATSNALMKGAVITSLGFNGCSFACGECAAILAKALSRNASVLDMKVVGLFDGVALPFDGVIRDALASALPSNSTLKELSFNSDRLSPFFLALGNNTGLKTLFLPRLDSIDESLCIAIKNGLEMNETLESLKINVIDRLCDDTAALWCRALSFIRTNEALKSLEVTVAHDSALCLYTFRIDIVAMLQENASLESIFILAGRDIMEYDTHGQNILGYDRDAIKAKEYVVLLTALNSLQHNTTLKCLSIYPDGSLRLTDNEDKQLATLLKKNYALERVPGIDRVGDAGAILRLNKAGRRYLMEDGSSISKGVEVLSKVNNDINCVFLHLLENPRLCNQSAVERVTDGESNVSRSTNPTDSSGRGKREQASTHKGKESRRRLA